MSTAKSTQYLIKLQNVLTATAIPFATLYSLHIMRPREIQFLNYLEERRRFEDDFDAMFDNHPVTSGESSSSSPPQRKQEDHFQELTSTVLAPGVTNAVGSGSADLFAKYHSNPSIKVSFDDYQFFCIGKVQFLRPEYADHAELRCVSITQHFWKQF